MYASIKNGSGVFRAIYEKGPVNEKNRKNKNPYSNYNVEPRFATMWFISAKISGQTQVINSRTLHRFLGQVVYCYFGLDLFAKSHQ